MSRRISSVLSLLGIIGSLLFVGTMQADPPRGSPKPRPVGEPEQVQIQVSALTFEVDHSELAKLAEKTPSAIAEFLKRNGFQTPDGDGNRDSVRITINDKPVAFDLNGQDIAPAVNRISNPTLRTIAGQKTRFQSGGEIPVPVGLAADRESTVGWREFGTKLAVHPNVDPDGDIVMEVRLENTQVGADAGFEFKGTKIPSLHTRAVSLFAKLKSGQHLLVVEGNGAGFTQFIQLSPHVILPERVSGFHAPNEPVPVARAVDRPARLDHAARDEVVPEPVVNAVAVLEQVSETHPATRLVNRVSFQVRIYEIDHTQLSSKNAKAKDAFDELLKPLKVGRREVQLNNCRVTAWTVKKPVTPEMLGDSLGKGLSEVSNPRISLLEGQPAVFDYGGSIPQVKLDLKTSSGNESASGQFRPLATQYSLDAAVVENQRVLVSFSFDPGNHDLTTHANKSGSAKKLNPDQHVRASAELAIGQTLCVSDFNKEWDDTNESLLVTITPESITQVTSTTAPPITRAMPVKPSVPKEVVVEDRWPVSEIKVGQQVMVMPVWLSKTSLSTSPHFLMLGQAKNALRVMQVKPLENRKGRQVTLALGAAFEGSDIDQARPFLDMLQSASTNFVVPLGEVSVTDFRWLDDFYAAIDPAQRPRPVELLVGESLLCTGLQGFVPIGPQDNHNRPQQVNGPFTLDMLDNNSGGIWRVTAAKTGTTRLVQCQEMGEGDDHGIRIRRTEYVVKADTRELESLFKQHFPTAKVTISTAGENALLLTGTATSEDDVKGIVELAGQFTPTVLNRLKVPSTDRAANATPSPIGLSLSPSSITISEPIKWGGIVDAPPRENSIQVSPPEPIDGVKSKELEELRREIRELRETIRDLIQRDATKGVE